MYVVLSSVTELTPAVNRSSNLTGVQEDVMYFAALISTAFSMLSTYFVTMLYFM
jgi:hypothetical protein